MAKHVLNNVVNCIGYCFGYFSFYLKRFEKSVFYRKYVYNSSKNSLISLDLVLYILDMEIQKGSKIFYFIKSTGYNYKLLSH